MGRSTVGKAPVCLEEHERWAIVRLQIFSAIRSQGGFPTEKSYPVCNFLPVLLSRGGMGVWVVGQVCIQGAYRGVCGPGRGAGGWA